MKKVDTYAGYHDFLRQMWPFEKFDVNEHAHNNVEGGYYNHIHENGNKKHSHKHEKIVDEK